MKRILKSSLALGLASTLTFGTATFVSAQEENQGAPQIPVPIEEPADTPEPAPDIEPVETPEPAEPAVPEETPAPQPTAPAEPTQPVAPTTPQPTPAPGLTIQETTPPATPQPPTDSVTPPAAVSQPQAVACRVVVIDRAARTITVEAEGQLHLLKMDPQAKIMKKGKLVTLDDVVPGQEIVVLARTTSDGVIQVVSIAIGPAKGKEQAAGSSRATGRANPNGVFNFPFQSFPNPANIGPATAPAPLTEPPAPVVTPST